jgi:hypothetical protein
MAKTTNTPAVPEGALPSAEAALEALAASVAALVAEQPGLRTFNLGSYRVVVTHGTELFSVTHR